MQILIHEIASRSASGVEIRSLAPTDRDPLAAAFARLGEETRRRRFGGLASRLGERDLDRLTQVDHHEREALAASAFAAARSWASRGTSRCRTTRVRPRSR